MLVIEEKFITCGGRHIPCMGSPYPKNEVPEELFKGKDNKIYKQCLHCRNYKVAYIASTKEKKKTIINDEYSYCPYTGHGNIVKSSHARNKVPIKLFRKDENDPDSKIYINCLDCRVYTKIYSTKYATEKKQKIISTKKDNTEYLYCSYTGHETIVKSVHPRDKVPIELFRAEQNNPKSHIFDMCIDCRIYYNEKNKKNKSVLKSKLEEKGLHDCGKCHKKFKNEEMGFNLDGTLSTSCISCKIIGNPDKQYRIDIKLDIIKKNQCSCVKCNNLFFKPDNNGIIVKKILTYEKEGNKCAIYNGEEMLVKDIIDLYYNELELKVLALDHLTESEQRERGLLLEHEKYIPKRKSVSLIKGKKSIKTETLKCQMLCIMCYVEAIIKREKGTRKYGNVKLKCDYVKKCKDNGCSSCGYININIPRLFDMDHINPDNKIESISNMCQKTNYNLDDVINECEKCRVLCKFCHTLHSIKQQKERFLNKLKYEISEENDTDDNDYISF